MMRWTLVRVGLLLAALLAFTGPALAGGWAVVTLDTLPEKPRAGATLQIGFMVRQHGVRPTDSVAPYLSATNLETGDVLRTDARKDGPEGHFVVDVRFPTAGTWEWQITPEPFQATKLGRLSILPPASTAPRPIATGEVVREPMAAPSALRWAGTIMLLAAIGLALTGHRGMPSRRRALRPR